VHKRQATVPTSEHQPCPADPHFQSNQGNLPNQSTVTLLVPLRRQRLTQPSVPRKFRSSRSDGPRETFQKRHATVTTALLRNADGDRDQYTERRPKSGMALRGRQEHERRATFAFVFTCGVRNDGSLTCWGDNSYGQATPPTGSFTQVSAGTFHTCGIRSDGSVSCWGDNTASTATPPAGSFIQLSTGFLHPYVGHTCGVRSDGWVACWGANGLGQATPPGGRFTQLSAGPEHTCGVRSDGLVSCWGGTSFGKTTPPAGTFTQVSAGFTYTCGIRSDGWLACWGAVSR
jgi:hypothetical protein